MRGPRLELGLWGYEPHQTTRPSHPHGASRGTRTRDNSLEDCCVATTPVMHGANGGTRTLYLVLTKDAHFRMCFEGIGGSGETRTPTTRRSSRFSKPLTAPVGASMAEPRGLEPLCPCRLVVSSDAHLPFCQGSMAEPKGLEPLQPHQPSPLSRRRSTPMRGSTVLRFLTKPPANVLM